MAPAVCRESADKTPAEVRRLHAELIPDDPECSGKIVGPPGHPRINRVRRKPRPSPNLACLQVKWPLVLGPVDPAEFPACLRPSLQLEETGRHGIESDPQFLGHFPQATGVVLLAAVEMARGRGIPDARPVVLGQGSLLQEELASRVEDQDMHRAVTEIEPMNLRTGCGTDHLIAFIDDIKDFFGHAVSKGGP